MDEIIGICDTKSHFQTSNSRLKDTAAHRLGSTSFLFLHI